MTITELRYLTLEPSSSGSSSETDIPRTLLSSTAAAFAAQESWTARHLPAPANPGPGLRARGVAFFQQVEDPTVTLVTTHWAGPAAHSEWRTSADYAATAAPLVPHFVAEGERGVRILYVDNGAFEGKGAGLEERPVLSVGRWFVKPDQRPAVEELLNKMGVLEKAAVVVGWKIHGASDDAGPDKALEQLVIFTGWDSVEAHEAVAHFLMDALTPVVERDDVRHYKRVL